MARRWHTGGTMMATNGQQWSTMATDGQIGTVMGRGKVWQGLPLDNWSIWQIFGNAPYLGIGQTQLGESNRKYFDFDTNTFCRRQHHIFGLTTPVPTFF